MSDFIYDVDAVMTNGIIPALNSYVFIGASATTFDIEFIDGTGTTIGVYSTVTCPATSTSLRSIMNTHNPASVAVLDAAVGAFIKAGSANIFYNTSGDKTTGVPAVAPTTSSIRRFLATNSYGIGWGN